MMKFTIEFKSLFKLSQFYRNQSNYRSQLNNMKNNIQMIRACQVISNWSKRWRVKFSTSKTQSMNISTSSTSKNKLYQFKINDNIIEYCKTYKYLGLYIESKGKWSTQFHSVRNKLTFASSLISKLKYNRTCISLPIARKLSIAIAQSQITHALPYWQPTSNQFKQFDSILARPFRHILQLPKTTQTIALLVEAHILPTQQIQQKLTFNWAAQTINRAHKQTDLMQSADVLKQSYQAATAIKPTASSLAKHSNFINNLVQLELHFNLKHCEQRFSNNRQLEFKLRSCLWQTVLSKWMLERQNVQLGLRKYYHNKSSLHHYPLFYKFDSPQAATIRAKFRFDLSLANFSSIYQRPNVSPYCQSCQSINNNQLPLESRQHLLTDCKLFNSQRYSLRSKLLAISPRLILTEELLIGDISSIPKGLKKKYSSIFDLTSSFLYEIHSKLLVRLNQTRFSQRDTL